MGTERFVNKIIASREHLIPDNGFTLSRKVTAEGGCGVIGFACNVQVAAKHMLESLAQMRNRGNGKGGGIAAVGLIPEEFGVTLDILENDYLLAVAYLDKSVRHELEQSYIQSIFEVDHIRQEEHVSDYTAIEGLDVRPPEVVEYFVRLKSDIVKEFVNENKLTGTPLRKVEDEIVFQNSYQLNKTYYQSTGEKKAFVLSHGKNLLVLKMVGYGDDVIRYYQLENIHAHVWIGHHRYPTKGRVWHPGGAHPFIGLNEALVHNGDFANHASISEYLAQRNIYPLFLTDTEVAVQVFDLLHRTYDYPIEYVIEAMAPTTERDFTLLPPDKRYIYEMLQSSHMHSSPDGPWFFLIAQSDTHPKSGPVYRLTGITDTSMLRPQVFAWQENKLDVGQRVAIGFAASEKQAIDAALESLAAEDPRFWTRADRYWNARGGSHKDGGAFLFSVSPNGSNIDIVCTDKFGRKVPAPVNSSAYIPNGRMEILSKLDIPLLPVEDQFTWFKNEVIHWDYSQIIALLKGLESIGQADGNWDNLIQLLTLLLDRRYDTGKLRRSSLLTLVDQSFTRTIEAIKQAPTKSYTYYPAGSRIPDASGFDQTMILDAGQYSPQGETSVARQVHRLYESGFKRFLIAHAKGHRFIGNGFGPNTDGVRIDVYGSPGDYLASGLDGMEIHVHNSGQDQVAQIMKSGKLVVHGSVGQTFMYAAKGGEAYILGDTAGRALINAVGKPRVIINGTCLDYLAESFMAGNALNGGGFVVLNGITFNEHNQIVDMYTPYPGGNLFSLASGGAIYLRDPNGVVSDKQLNGGEFTPLTQEDWALIEPYLQENAHLFGISINRLLSVDGGKRQPGQVYRKIEPRVTRALQAEEAWVTESGD